MRKLILALSLAITFCVPAFAIDDPQYKNIVQLRGDGTGQETSPRIVKLVRNPLMGNSAVSFVSTDSVVYDLVSDDGVTVTTSVVSADNAFAGICATAIPSADISTSTLVDDVGRRNWGWIVVHGPAVAKISAGGTNGNAAGDPFITSVDVGTVTTLETLVNVAAADINRVTKDVTAASGFFMDAAGTGPTSTSMEVFVENT